MAGLEKGDCTVRLAVVFRPERSRGCAAHPRVPNRTSMPSAPIPALFAEERRVRSANFTATKLAELGRPSVLFEA
jgi:hypothetical protein